MNRPFLLTILLAICCASSLAHLSSDPSIDCDKGFRSVTLGGTNYQQSVRSVSWSTANEICQECFGSLADVSAATAMNERNRSDLVLWIGSFNGGITFEDLAWFTETGNIVVLADGQNRPALCRGSGPAPTPRPPTPRPPTPRPPTPTPTPTPSVCPPCPPCPPTPRPPTPRPPTPRPPTPRPPTPRPPTPRPPTPRPPTPRPPTPTPPCNFERRTYGGRQYEQSVNTYANWDLAEDACKRCFRSKLADIFNASATGRSRLELFIGSYQGGEVTEGLVWFQADGRINQVDDNVARRALCNHDGHHDHHHDDDD